MTQNWLAFVPIRGGSKGLPGKNIRDLAGRPLYQHSLEHAQNAGASRCFISTDIAEVSNKDHGVGVEIMARPAEIASDQTPMDDVLGHFVDNIPDEDTTIVLLQATSPLRRVTHITAALEAYKSGAHDLVMSVTATDRGILKYGTRQNGRFVPVSDPKYCFTNRQALPEVFRPNGAVYVFGADWFRKTRKLATDRIGMIEMDKESSRDIDTEADFLAVEAILQLR